MKHKPNYTILGFSVVSLTVMMLALFFWLSSDGHVQEFKTYLLRTKESVSGLTRESSVLYNGVKVGYVSEIHIDQHDPDTVNILIQVDNKVPVTISTFATLDTRGLTGVIYVSLKNKTSSHVVLQSKRGFKYPIIPVKKSLLSQLINLIPNIGKTLTASSDGVVKLFSEQNVKNITSTLSNLNTITTDYKKNQLDIMHQLNATLIKLDSVAGVVEKSTQHFDRAIVSSKVLMDNLTQQSLSQLPTLFDQLNSVTLNLKHLASTVKSEPSILVRGRAERNYGPGEK
jgi:phospholipid/cholesterol/gamma-HCH transport system substrate-binding protein